MPDVRPSKGTVLLVEDDADVIGVAEQLYRDQNFNVVVAKTAKDAFAAIFKSPPDLIVLDINLPDLDGFHVAQELKRNMMLRHIPVILLSGRADFIEKMRSMDVMVDEYLVKPFDVQEMILRSKLVLERSRTNLDANPLTRLPGNQAIVEAIKARIGKGKPYAVGYADLNNFKAYNDKYGFSQGDKMITLAARTIVSSVQRLSPKESFVGHIGGDDFLFICGYDQANEICQAITSQFDKEVPSFYSEEDQKNGFIVVEDRRGVESKFPFVSIAIGMVSDEGQKFTNIGQINHSLTQLKKYAKSFQGSAVVRDRRTLAASMAEFTWGPGSVEGGSSKVLASITAALNSYMPDQLSDIINKKQISVLFQPVIEMKGDLVVGHEGLVRGPAGTPLEYPDALFQTARTAGKVTDLDLLCIELVVAAAQEFRKGMKLFINIYPETLLDEQERFKRIMTDQRVRNMDLVFELSGSHRASDASDLFVTLRRMKQQGMKICIDGSVILSGYGLRFLPELQPNYVKLNMMTYKDMTHDVERRREFSDTVRMIRQVGSEAICTKLESRADSIIAMTEGVTLGQGFLFASPALPASTLPLK
jgi:diguanylate cyclase (GGDEF)-like protein